jgi:hypothetical protein
MRFPALTPNRFPNLSSIHALLRAMDCGAVILAMVGQGSWRLLALGYKSELRYFSKWSW